MQIGVAHVNRHGQLTPDTYHRQRKHTPGNEPRHYIQGQPFIKGFAFQCYSTFAPTLYTSQIHDERPTSISIRQPPSLFPTIFDQSCGIQQWQTTNNLPSHLFPTRNFSYLGSSLIDCLIARARLFRNIAYSIRAETSRLSIAWFIHF